MHPVFHISLLRCHQESPAEFETRTPAPPPPDIINNHPEYEVEAITAHRRQHHKLEFLVTSPQQFFGTLFTRPRRRKNKGLYTQNTFVRTMCLGASSIPHRSQSVMRPRSGGILTISRLVGDENQMVVDVVSPLDFNPFTHHSPETRHPKSREMNEFSHKVITGNKKKPYREFLPMSKDGPKCSNCGAVTSSKWRPINKARCGSRIVDGDCGIIFSGMLCNRCYSRLGSRACIPTQITPNQVRSYHVK